MVIIDIMEVHRISWWIRGWKCINVIVMVGQVKRNQVSQDCWYIIYEDREFLNKLKSSCPLTSVFNSHHTSFISSKSEGKSEPHDILFRKDTRDYCVSGFFEWFPDLSCHWITLDITALLDSDSCALVWDTIYNRLEEPESHPFQSARNFQWARTMTFCRWLAVTLSVTSCWDLPILKNCQWQLWDENLCAHNIKIKTQAGELPMKAVKWHYN